MHDRELPLRVRVRGPLALGGLTCVLVWMLSSVGLPAGMPRSFGPITVLSAIASAGLIACAYVLGGFGLGRPLVAVLAPGSPHRRWIQLVLGFGMMMWVSHLAGMMGVLSGAGVWPRVMGWGMVAVGIGLALDQGARGLSQKRTGSPTTMPWAALLWAPAIALLLVAASNPPGALWRSEFGAFDVLSYHLQLPKEWAAGERVWPVEHNVYSYLPSLVESAFVHLGAMMPGSSEPIDRMLGGEGMWVLASQMLHALWAIVAGLLCGRLGAACAERVGKQASVCRVIGLLTGALVVGTPWMIVVGSLAYNEAALVALSAGAALAAMDVRITPGRRAVLAGTLVGLACGCKPTALIFVGPMVGVMLLVHATGPRAKAWFFTAVLGSIGGLLAIGPWLVRNAMASGNPVFPFAAGVFGNGHWTSEQIARHATNHHAPAGTGAGDRVARLLGAEFGLTHPQYAILIVMLTLGIAGAIAWRRSRTLALCALAGVVVQAAAWMLLTHMQSRFLITMLVPAAMGFGLGGAALVAWVSRGRSAAAAALVVRAAMCVLALAPISQVARSVLLFLGEDSGTPNRLLVFGPGTLTGGTLVSAYERGDESARRELLDRLPTFEAFVNLGLRPQDASSAGEGVYLLGDSTPMYVLGATGGRQSSPVVYHTTWDRSPLGDAIAASPDEPKTWSLALRSLGVRHVLVNFDELGRLTSRDRYYDPRVRVEDVARWLASPTSGLRRVRDWRNDGAPAGTVSGRTLFRIELENDGAKGAGRP
ncbi:MAG: hypothetical protein K2W85_05835 [Phycisphaerales bacterium]|nr:hypothetical protein [Phycisphaerales bacterium]